MTPTYETVMAAGRDAGNRSMTAAGRAAWSEEDWSAAEAAMIQMLLAMVPASPAIRPQSLAREGYEAAWREKQRLR